MRWMSVVLLPEPAPALTTVLCPVERIISHWLAVGDFPVRAGSSERTWAARASSMRNSPGRKSGSGFRVVS